MYSCLNFSIVGYKKGNEKYKMNGEIKIAEIEDLGLIFFLLKNDFIISNTLR